MARLPDGSTFHWREEQILKLTAHGLMEDEIARELLIGVETVKTYRKRLKLSLGATNLAHAVGIGFRLGILD